jgi:ADP-ribosyl-[dinitrogen reductase] hydrolase
MSEDRDRFRGCLLGLACGDAVGTTVEFKRRGTFAPLTDMVGGGPFGLKPGQWTDDTSMALCLANSLTELGRFDAHDQMTRYLRWWQDGYCSATGSCFDIGGTTSSALSAFGRTGDPFSGPTHDRSLGNGSIMRLAPVPLFFYPNHEQAVTMAGESSRTTHGHPQCIDACRLLAAVLCRLLDGGDKASVVFPGHDGRWAAPEILEVAGGGYIEKAEQDIVGSGHVTRSLEAALWSLVTTESFEAAILKAANLGDDADTTAAVCGQIAGAYYGASGIPSRWLGKLAMREDIETLADRLLEAKPGTPGQG